MLGLYVDVWVDFEGFFFIEVGDIFLFCSDGLVGEVDDEEFGLIIVYLFLVEVV